MDVTLRDATARDAAPCAQIYGFYVRHTHISFETEPPDAPEMARRIAGYADRYAWLVAERDGAVVGFAYGSPYSPRPAYRWAVETSVYLEPGLRRSGTGRALYEALLGRLAARGYRRVVAGLALPNDASLGLHVALGFEVVGTLRRIGWKHGSWHDVVRLQKDLVPELGAAPPDASPA